MTLQQRVPPPAVIATATREATQKVIVSCTLGEQAHRPQTARPFEAEIHE